MYEDEQMSVFAINSGKSSSFFDIFYGTRLILLLLKRGLEVLNRGGIV